MVTKNEIEEACNTLTRCSTSSIKTIELMRKAALAKLCTKCEKAPPEDMISNGVCFYCLTDEKDG